MSAPLGIYVHIPFCKKKCDYCDFYSVENGEDLFRDYVSAVLRSIDRFRDMTDKSADTLYFGGGTPSLLPPEMIGKITEKAAEKFGLHNAEITVECNPSTVGRGYFEGLKDAGVNRISLGLQSVNAGERAALGRRSAPQDAKRAAEEAVRSGFKNISLDLMLGIPFQTEESLEESVEFCKDVGASHVSAYILKVEKGTPLERKNIILPDEEEQARMYLAACEMLDNAGFRQYEISNFCLPGRESRHNLKYWNDDEYIGIGAASHSFLNGERFYYPRSVRDFISGCDAVSDGRGGDFEEYCMLRLRLTDGINDRECEERFGHGILEEIKKRAFELQKHSLTKCGKDSVSLTRQGFLLSNSVIAHLLG